MLISLLRLMAQQKNSLLLLQTTRKKLADLCTSSTKRLEELLQSKSVESSSLSHSPVTSIH
jgi:hypothetical protein